ncbi:MAG TPA: HEAT repeat domain-containing protein [Cellvibrio sp.]|nr:HEAT repeat domain-containing protein [Cellvibrio sp.]
MGLHRYSIGHLLLAAAIGAAVCYGMLWFISNDAQQREKIAALEQQIQTLQLAQKPPSRESDETANQALNIEQLRKDLSTRFIGDPRTLGEKLRDFVAQNPGEQNIAIACKVVADLAENSDAMANEELIQLYNNQTHAEFKRVIAQVLSLRGDNSLLEQQVRTAQTELKSDDPQARRQVLGALAKTRYAGAAKAIAPLVQDADSTVKLDALLALRATGNESHIKALGNLVGDPDPSVSWLAQDVISNLENLSTKARTKVSLNDINAELPVIAGAAN